jgi:hypothetical protein
MEEEHPHLAEEDHRPDRLDHRHQAHRHQDRLEEGNLEEGRPEQDHQDHRDHQDPLDPDRLEEDHPGRPHRQDTHQDGRPGATLSTPTLSKTVNKRR